MIGKTLGGYRIVEQVGVGGMASVFKAYDAATDRNVALKILPEYYAQDPTFRERFQREAKAIARLEHLHILPIFAYGEEGGIAYLVMRYMPAGALSDRIRLGPLALSEASHLLGQIGSALDHAHRHGILHRDVKPSNVVLDDQGNAYLTDFGIAKILEGTSSLTGNAVMGTPQYMSPEQCQDAGKIIAASDQYSLGVILYEMVTGSAPFRAETPVAILLKQLNDPLPPPHALRPDLPERAEQVIFKALAKEPENRFLTCGAMSSAFADAIASAPDQPRPIAQTRPASAAATQTAQPEPAALTVPAVRLEEKPAAQRGFPWWVVVILIVVILGVGAVGVLLAPAFEPDPGAGPTPSSTRRSVTVQIPPRGPVHIVDVMGTSDWVDSGISLRSGAVVYLKASGEVTPCSNTSNPLCIAYGPDGMPDSYSAIDAKDPAANTYPLPDQAISALVGRIGDGHPFLVGKEATITADAAGHLSFRVNDQPLSNNSGAFSVTVEIIKE